MCYLVDQGIALTQCYTGCDSVGVTVDAVQAIWLSEIMGRVQVGGDHQPPHNSYKLSGLQVDICVARLVITHPCINPKRFQRGDL